MPVQMVSRFRVKKLSPKHPLPVYKESQLPDLIDPASIQRAAPQIETGVEKEEEEEHDLQAAISAHQAAVTTGAKIESYIPIPDASNTIDPKDYELLYKKKYKEPSTLIRFSSTVEDSIGCPYFMDEIDEQFLNKYNSEHTTLSEDDFEKIMYEFESVVKEKLPHLHLDPDHIPDFDGFLEDLLPESSFLHSRAKVLINPIYQHWKHRKGERKGLSIIPDLKFEETSKNEIDPYTCFRRRETKPLRKTRRTDAQSLQRLRTLRSEMEVARNLLEMVLRREKIRKESMVLEHSVFEKKCQLREYQKILGIREDEDLILAPSASLSIAATQASARKKQKGSSGATIKIPLNRLRRDNRLGIAEKSPAQLAIEAELAKKKRLDAPYEDLTECPYQPFPMRLPSQFFQRSSNGIRYRKRVGRGGRIFIDRKGYSTHTSSNPATSGKTKPGVSLSRYQTGTDHHHNRYAFDSDSDEEESDREVEEMQDSYLKHRAQLLSETELRSLFTIPFITPLNMINLQTTRSLTNNNSTTPSSSTSLINNNARPNSNNSPHPSTSTPSNTTYPLLNATNNNTAFTMASSSQRLSIATGAVNIDKSTNKSPIASPHMIKKQISRSRMTPQQAAVAMANDMIAANINAAVSAAASQPSASSSPVSPNTNRNPMALVAAAAVAHKQQQQQQQTTSVNGGV